MTTQDNNFNSGSQRTRRRLQAHLESNSERHLNYLELLVANVSWLNDEQISAFTLALNALALTWHSTHELTKLFYTMDLPSNAQKLIADKLATLDDEDFVPVVFYATPNMHHDWIQTFYGVIFNDLEPIAILNKISSEAVELASQVASRLSETELDCETDNCREALTSYIERFSKSP